MKTDKWVCVTDFTMNKGPVSILPPLRIAESSMNQGRAIRLSDVECLDVIPMVKCTGEDVVDRYEALFERVGYPSAFLQDQGKNLGTASTLLNARRALKDLKPIPVILDLGHYSATLVKKEFKDQELVKKLLEKLSEFNLKLRMTKCSFLCGPKSRSAGRYMGYMKQVLRWLFYLKKLSFAPGNPIEGTVRHLILCLFPDLRQTLRKLSGFIEVTEVEEFLLTRLKNEGLSAKTYYEVRRKLLELPENHFYRIGMLEWLHSTWQIRKTMGITGALTVSSDIIETANGCWKQLTERMPSNETTALVLAFPTFCGSATQEELSALIRSTPLKEVKQWSEKRVPITQRKLKNFNFHADTLLSEIDQLFSSCTADMEPC